jgi:hypothetical protein
MYTQLMYDFMEFKKMICKVIIFIFSKFGQVITPLVYSRKFFGKPGIIEKLRGENL